MAQTSGDGSRERGRQGDGIVVAGDHEAISYRLIPTITPSSVGKIWVRRVLGFACDRDSECFPGRIPAHNNLGRGRRTARRPWQGKRPARFPGLVVIALVALLQGNDVFRLRSLFALYFVELNLLPILQRPASGSDDGSKVNKEVGTVLSLNKSVTFVIVEPFDGTGLLLRHI